MRWGPLFCLKSELREESSACFFCSCCAVLEGNVSSRKQNLPPQPSSPPSTPSNLSTMDHRPSLRRRGPTSLCLPWTILGSRSPLSLHSGYCWPLSPKLVPFHECVEQKHCFVQKKCRVTVKMLGSENCSGQQKKCQYCFWLNLSAPCKITCLLLHFSSFYILHKYQTFFA